MKDDGRTTKNEGQMRILLADDQPKVRLGLRLLLEQEEWASVVGEAADAESLLALAEAAQPDLVVLDWSLQRSERPDLLPTLRGCCPGLAVVVLSGQPDAQQEALDAGADAFVSKADPPELLLEAMAGAQRAENSANASAAKRMDEQSYQNQTKKTGGTR